LAIANSEEEINLAINLRNKIYGYLKFRPYNSKTERHEKIIRWKRTAH